MRIIADLKIQPTESIDNKATIVENDITEAQLDIFNKKDEVQYDRGNLSNRELRRVTENKKESRNSHS